MKEDATPKRSKEGEPFGEGLGLKITTISPKEKQRVKARAVKRLFAGRHPVSHLVSFVGDFGFC